MSDQKAPPEISITPPGFTLTKEFLEIAFEKEVEEFSTNLGTNPGDNYLSIIHAVDVKFKGGKDTKHYLLKCYPNNVGRREFLDQVNVFEKELFMYSDFLPQLKKLAENSNDPEKVSLSVAPFHGGNVAVSPCEKFNMDPWFRENFIIMTDLRKTDGFRMADRMEGLDWDHIKLVIPEIAKLHALTWAYKEKNGIKLLTEKYPRFIDTMHGNQESMEAFKTVMEQINGNALKAVNEGLGSEHPAFKNFKSFMENDVFETILKKSTEPNGIDEDLQESFLRVKPNNDVGYCKEPWLLGNHGDCWVNNMLFQYDNNEPPKPAKITLIDYQVFREGCPTLDLAYFLSCSVRSSVRIPHLNEILQLYHDAFLSSCKALSVKPLPGFTMDNLKRRYRRAKLYGLVISLPLLTFVLKPPEESIDMDQIKSDDIGEVFSTVLEGSDRNAKFREELSATVLDLYEDGVI